MSLIDPSARYWMTDSARVAARDDLVSDSERSVCRLVIVIDPEDREQVDRLERLMADNCGWSRSEPMRTQRADGLEDALRSLIAPPKPPEPKGLGAVVEDAEGGQWIRYGHGPAPWMFAASSPDNRDTYPWHAIAAVKVLSEGVTA